MKQYRVKLGVVVRYETFIDVKANSAAIAMEAVMDASNKGLISPVKLTSTSLPALISVEEIDT